MPTIRVNQTGSSTDALQGEKFKTQQRPAFVSIYASGATEGDTVSFSVESQEYLSNAPANVEAASGVVDTDRDGLLFQELVPAGEYFLPLTMTTNMSVMVVIEYQ